MHLLISYNSLSEAGDFTPYEDTNKYVIALYPLTEPIEAVESFVDFSFVYGYFEFG